MGDSEKLSKQATLASVGVALILIITKTWAYWTTGSVSLLGSLLDSILDGVTSLMNFFALRFALEPADEDHKFGHGKLESIAALGQSAFMIGSAVVLVLNSFDVMFDERTVVNSEVGIAVCILAIILTLMLVMFQKYVTRKSRSLIVEADSLHYQGDLLMDIDFFKKYNDGYGHIKGDECLRAVAQTLKKALKRPIDVLARYGGEEFVVLLPDTDLIGAKAVGDRLISALTSANIPHEFSDVQPYVTISIGAAEKTPDQTLKTILQTADEALYKAKEAGRNQVIC